MKHGKLRQIVNNLGQPAPPFFSCKLVFVVLVIVSLAAAGWHTHDRIQPITQDDRAILTALADQVASKTGVSRRQIWEEIKRSLSVRRIEEIRRGDMHQIVDDLTKRLRH